MTSDDLDSDIEALERQVEKAFKGGATWKEVWDAIRAVSALFKTVRYPDRGSHQTAWLRFQAVVGEVKAQQAEASRLRGALMEKSSHHLSKIVGYAEEVEFDDQLLNGILNVVSLGAFDMMHGVLKAVGGHYDELKEALQTRGEILRKGWSYLSAHKQEMTGADKSAAHARLERARAKLDQHWTEWKVLRGKDYEARHAAREARNAEFQEKQDNWRANQRTFIAKQEDGIGRLEAVRSRKVDHLEELAEKLSEARSESYRERVSGWISDEQDQIREIDEKIASAKSKLNEARGRLVG